ncbi:MAG: 3-deoxy-7-phosphoheptulonate synthase [Candidatus Melainabacteria bacterium RIFCSPHIGHO2_02_FULL_34_12]|nr:MAG: 3-deoxy-7-phosphoheptulonate synthase [Candidatus Melainabacteria bacterium RIFCSPHIGHO2_02_FULL_34_12]
MIIIMEPESTQEQVDKVVKHIHDLGMKTILNKGVVQTVIAAIGETSKYSTDQFEILEGVRTVQRIQVPFKLASRDAHHLDTVVTVGKNIKFGGDNPPVIIAGPCSVENQENLLAIANVAKECGAKVLRGGAFKPRTGPRAFEGLGKLGLEFLDVARKETGLAVVTEIMDARDLEMICNFTDILQVGARNMQNFTLLNEIGKTNKPVLLKRGLAATIDEWLLAAERIMDKGNTQIIMCERGIRTFDNKYTRNTADIAAIPVIKRLSHLPVIFDPSHATGKWNLVAPLAKAAVVAGAHGLIIEVHPEPEKALSDGPQTLNFENFRNLVKEIDRLIKVLAPA